MTSHSTRRIAVFRALYLGDLLLAVPALRAIRVNFPRAEITLIGLPWAASFARRFHHYIDRFVEFVGYPGINEVDVIPHRTRRFLAEQRAYSYDLVIQMHGSGHTSNPFALALGGRATAGYFEDCCLPGEQDSREKLTIAAPYPHDRHEIFRNLDLVSLLGCSNLDPGLEFPLFDENRAEAAGLLKKLRRAKGPLIGLHPGSHSPARRWPVEYFAATADYLARRFGARLILTGGPGEEAIAQTVDAHMQTRPLDVAGKTSIGGLAALISGLDLFISNDTGPAHIATAVNTPSVTIFGPADCRRWAPLDQVHHPVVQRPVACSPCSYWECPIDHRCLRWLSPAMVIKEAGRLLERNLHSSRTAKYHKDSAHHVHTGMKGGLYPETGRKTIPCDV